MEDLCLVQAQSLHANFSTTVLLLPVGHVPPDVLARYVAAFSRFTVMTMDEVMPPGDYSREESAFKYLSWTADNAVNFRYQLGPALPHHYIPAPRSHGGVSQSHHAGVTLGGEHPQGWGMLHAHLNVMVVIGLWHCPSFPDLPAAYESFRSRAAQFSAAPVMRCFAFEPSLEHMSHEALSSMPLLHLFPTAMSGEAAPTAVDPQVTMLLNMQLSGVCTELLQWFEGNIAGARSGTGPTLRTPLDDDVVATAVARKERSRRKRDAGRAEKLAGDYALLAGSPSDAVERYTEALALCKSVGDGVWAGGAAEGIAAALIAFRAARDGVPPADVPLLSAVIDRCEEAAGFYAAASPELHAQIRVKVGRYLLTAPGLGAAPRAAPGDAADDPYHRTSPADAKFAGASHLTVAASLPGVPPAFKVATLVECHALVAAAGLNRKAAHFLHTLSELLLAMGFQEAARRLACYAAAMYGIRARPQDALSDFGGRPPAPPGSRPASPSAALHVPEVPTVHAWPCHTVGLTALLVDMADAYGDVPAVVDCLAYLLVHVAALSRFARESPAGVDPPRGPLFSPSASALRSSAGQQATPTAAGPSEGPSPTRLRRLRHPAGSIASPRNSRGLLPPRPPPLSLASPASSFASAFDAVASPAAAAVGLCERLGLPPHVANGVCAALHAMSAARPRRGALLSPAGTASGGGGTPRATIGGGAGTLLVSRWRTSRRRSPSPEPPPPPPGGASRSRSTPRSRPGSEDSRRRPPPLDTPRSASSWAAGRSAWVVDDTTPIPFQVDDLLLSSDDPVALPLGDTLARATARPLHIGTDTRGEAITPDATSWWLRIHGLDGGAPQASPPAVPPAAPPPPDAPATAPPLAPTRVVSPPRLNGAPHRSVAEALAGVPAAHLLDSPLSPGRVDAALSVVSPSPRRSRAASDATDVKDVELVDAARSRSAPSSPSSQVSHPGIPVAMSMHPMPVAKTLWGMLKRLAMMLTPSQRCAVDFTALPRLVSVVATPLPPSVVPAVRRRRLRVRGTGDGAAPQSTFLYDPSARRGGRAAPGGHGSRAAVSKGPRVVWVVGRRCRLQVTLHNPLPISVRMGVTAVVKYGADGGGVEQPQEYARGDDGRPVPVVAGGFLSEEVVVKLAPGKQPSTVFVALTLPNLPPGLGDGVSATTAVVTSVFIRMGGYRWLHAPGDAAFPDPVPVHPRAPSLQLDPARILLPPSLALVPTVPPAGPEATAATDFYVLDGQSVMLPLWLRNPSTSVAAGWVALTCQVAAGGRRAAPAPADGATFFPKVTLFTTDAGETPDEPSPVPALPHPFAAPCAPDVCADAASAVTVSGVCVDAVGGEAGGEGVVPPQGLLRAVLAVSCHARDASLGRALAAFKLEWQCSRDVFSPYVVTLSHTLAFHVLDGPCVTNVEPMPREGAAAPDSAAGLGGDDGLDLSSTLLLTVRNPTDARLRVVPTTAAQCSIVGCACGPLVTECPADGCPACSVPPRDVMEVQVSFVRRGDGPQGGDEASRWRQLLRLDWQLADGPLGSMLAPVALFTPSVVTALRRPAVVADLVLDGGGRNVPVGTWLDCRVGFWYPAATVGAKAKDIKLVVVPERDLRACWAAMGAGEEGAVEGLDWFDDMMLSGWVQGETLEMVPGATPGRRFSMCPLVAGGRWVVWVEYTPSIGLRSRSNVIRVATA